MKSSTLRRSNLSREKMAVLEELAKAKRSQQQKDEVIAYAKTSKDKELDVLWQNFRVNQKNDKSPGVYLITGFIAGAIAMLIVTVLLNVTVNSAKNAVEDFDAPVKVKKENTRLMFLPPDKSAKKAEVAVPAATENYTVQSGDTLESIIIKFYGSFGLDKVEKIKKANNLENPNNLQIDQKLIIPME